MNKVGATVAATTMLLVELFFAGPVSALVSNPNGMVFRAIGIFQGEVQEGKCKVPVAAQLIADVSNHICRDATEIVTADGTSVFPTRMFPELQSFGNFCGGFLGLQSSLVNQAINVFRVKIRYKIPGRGFPILCRGQRKFNNFVGARIDPVNSLNPAPFGVVNQTYLQLLPIYSAEFLNCLRDPLRGNVAAPVTVVAKIRALAILDDGRKIRSNRVRYTLTLLPQGSTSGSSGGIPQIGAATRCAAAVQ